MQKNPAVMACMAHMRETVDDAFAVRFSEARRMAESMDIIITVPRQDCRQICQENHPADTPGEYYRRSIAILFLEHLVSDE